MKIKEIINYSDTEPLEILLAVVMIAQLCHPSPSIFCWHSVIPNYYYLFGALSGAGLLIGNIVGNIDIRKWSANLGFIIILGIMIISIFNGLSNLQFYAILFFEFLALLWVTWRCSRDVIIKNLKTKENN
jgi:hypothetical protein